MKPKSSSDKTNSELFLPPGVQEKEPIQTGYVIKAGPGYPIHLPITEDEEPWKEAEEKIKYIPLQAKEGDLIIYLQKNAYEIIYEEEKYYIVPQHSVLLIVREEDLFA